MPSSVNSTHSSVASDQSLVYDPNSRRMVPKADLLAREQGIEPSEKPVRRKKKQQQQQQQSGLSRSGSHLAQGTVARIRGSAVEGEERRVQTHSQPQAQIQQQVKTQPQPMVRAQAQSQRFVHAENPEPKTRQRHPQTEQAAPIMTAAVAAAVASRSGPRSSEPPRSQSPETVTRDVRVSDGATVLPQAQPRDNTPIIGRTGPDQQESSEDEEEEDDEEKLSEEAPAHAQSEPHNLDAPPVNRARHSSPPSFSTSSTAVEGFADNAPSSAPSNQHGGVRGLREHSNSPVRNARFALRTDQLVVMHEPPARSVSPRKSALKNSSSPSRGASPSEDGSDLGLEHYASHQDEPSSGRKKTVRVSFDEYSTQIIGESVPEQQSDSPVVPSPQANRRPWYSNIGRSKKKDLVALDDDEVMQPRPALPSFGSVREKKPRETEEERPLVRPVELEHPPAISASPAALPSSPDDDEMDDPVGQSTDSNIAAILSQENAAKNEANISKFREPLPPVVTSLEGSGYYSPSSSSSDNEDGEGSPPTQETFLESIAEAQSELTSSPLGKTKENAPLESTGSSHMNGIGAPHLEIDTGRDFSQDAIPSIAIIEPSPALREPSVNGATGGYFDVPGGYPSDDSDGNHGPEPDEAPLGRQAEVKTPVAPIQMVTAVPSASPDEPETPPPSTPVARAPGVSTINEEPESSGSSIYSDAYEDLSDAEGDGFLSLDAVLTTPVSEKVSKRLFEKALAGSSKETTKSDSIQVAALFAESTPATEPLETQDDWDKAKLYWKSLTNDKRKQLEREALEEAGVEADQEQIAQPKKTKKKRSARAAAVPKPAQPGTEQEPVQQRHGDAERNYQIKPGTKFASQNDTGVSSMRHSLRGAESQQGSGPGGGKLKKSMRASQPTAINAPEATMRRTLRSGPPETAPDHKAAAQEASVGDGNMRKSMRQHGNTQSGSPQQELSAKKSGRPLSLQQAPAPRKTGSNRKRQSSVDSPASTAALANVQPSLRRRGSDSSESSFKRARPQRQAQGLGFRRSMRAASPERPVETKSSRFSLRSLSPAGRHNTASLQPTSMGNRMSMRSTLRSESVDATASRMRVPTFGRSSAKKAAEKKNKTRYGDSSDEDVVEASTFRSRFADSSDDDEASAPLPASSKMPKSLRNGGGASSSAAAAAMNMPTNRQRQDPAEVSEDLPDSSDDDQPPPRRTASGRLVRSQSEGRGLQRKRSGRGELMESSTTPAVDSTEQATRPGHTRRGSFFSVLRRKKDKDGAGKILRPEPRESAARQGTKLERSNSEISALRANNAAPRLQKKQPANWPLTDTVVRPATSGGPSTGEPAPQPPFMKRRSISHTFGSSNQHEVQQNGEVAPELDEQSQAGGSVMKRKKFGKLRKMFGLLD
ncbi:hypothetical protein ACHAQH_008149 [Verticillium albo-atrum]